ncbi:hypothetical protein Aab01nite_04890 [Paractinoplanes abujensis]|nr:hypothetical protein Aab01nite_04890 [Actinoplanes abujensis]
MKQLDVRAEALAACAVPASNVTVDATATRPVLTVLDTADFVVRPPGFTIRAPAECRASNLEIDAPPAFFPFRLTTGPPPSKAFPRPFRPHQSS